MTPATYKELEAQYRREWEERKARRFEKASQNAKVLARIPSGKTIIEIRRAMRSRGHATKYKQVPQYWALEYKNGKLVHGQSMTERAYLKGRDYALQHHGIVLPIK